MSDDRPFNRYLRPARPAAADAAPAVATVAGFDANADAPTPMLDLVSADGDRLGVPYCELHAVTFKGEQITLEFTSRRVTLQGRNLLPLYNHLLLQLVRRIAVSPDGFDDGSASSWIASIEINQPEP